MIFLNIKRTISVSAVCCLLLLGWLALINSNKKDPGVIGQTAPNDMRFVKGEGNVPSFYIGVSEETNLNYVLYLHWLQNVYVDYPEVAEAAKPHPQNHQIHFNDPYLVYHMEHPAFAYYPVTGISWNQVNRYLQWKTDRLNEDILVRLNILQEDKHQMNENNFNSTAFLDGQYHGEHGKRAGILPVKWSDGILFPSFRLPSEAEWELLKPDQGIEQQSGFYPYGKDYFMLRWLKMFDDRDGRHTYTDEEVLPEYFHYWKKNKPVSNESGRIHGPWNSETPVNLNGNVKEWLLDFYREEKNLDWENTSEMFADNGYDPAIRSSSSLYDEYGLLLPKDYLGTLPFIIAGTEMDGSAWWVQTPVPYAPLVYGSILKPVYLAGDTLELIRNFDNFYHMFQHSIPGCYVYHKDADLPIPLHCLGWYYQYGQTAQDYSSKDSLQKEAYEWAKRLWNKLMDEGAVAIYRRYNLIVPCYLDAQGYYYLNSSYITIQATVRYGDSLRLVRGGDWNNPDHNARMPMHPDSAAYNVGFRCLLPYTSMPVKNRYRIKR